MKKATSLFMTALILFNLGSCHSNLVSYSDAQPCTELSEIALDSFDSPTNYTTANELFLIDYFETPSYVMDSIIRFASDSGNLNEIGIFHTTDGNAFHMADLLKTYLMQSYEKNRSWYDSYIPTETPKLRDAEIRIYGNYVVYAILSKDSKNQLFQSIEDQLRIS